MRRRKQSLEEILTNLSSIEAAWRDDVADAVIELLEGLPRRKDYSARQVVDLLEKDFTAGITTVRLFLDLSKDELERTLRAKLGGEGGIGVTRFRRDQPAFLAALEEMGLLQAMADAVGRPTAWYDVLVERLKSGRGSAIKGQRRGRYIEDFTERLVEKVFGGGGYDVRCRFLGEGGDGGSARP